MSVESRIIDLLYWMMATGFRPVKFCRKDRFLNPITKRIRLLNQLNESQVNYNLWIPTVDGLKHVLPGLTIEEVDGLKLVTYNGRIGAGTGESEAILSLLNDMRAAA